MPPPIITGQCACKKVSWSSTAPPQSLAFCYCTTCQQASGAPFAPWIGMAKSAISWTGSISSWRPTIGDSNTTVSTRMFCFNCGSCVAMQYDFYPEKTHLAAGTVTDGADVVPEISMHIWTKKLPCWYQIPEDGVERYQEMPQEYDEKVAKFVDGKT